MTYGIQPRHLADHGEPRFKIMRDVIKAALKDHQPHIIIGMPMQSAGSERGCRSARDAIENFWAFRMGICASIILAFVILNIPILGKIGSSKRRIMAANALKF